MRPNASAYEKQPTLDDQILRSERPAVCRNDPAVLFVPHSGPLHPTRFTSPIQSGRRLTSSVGSGAAGLSASKHCTHRPCVPLVQNGFFAVAVESLDSQTVRLPGTALTGGPSITRRTGRRTAAPPKYHRWDSTWRRTQNTSLPRSRKICRTGRTPGLPREWRASHSTLDKPDPRRWAPARHYRRGRPGRQKWGNASPALRRQGRSRSA